MSQISVLLSMKPEIMTSAQNNMLPGVLPVPWMDWQTEKHFKASYHLGSFPVFDSVADHFDIRKSENH